MDGKNNTHIYTSRNAIMYRFFPVGAQAFLIHQTISIAKTNTATIMAAFFRCTYCVCSHAWHNSSHGEG